MRWLIIVVLVILAGTACVHADQNVGNGANGCLPFGGAGIASNTGNGASVTSSGGCSSGGSANNLGDAPVNIHHVPNDCLDGSFGGQTAGATATTTNTTSASQVQAFCSYARGQTANAAIQKNHLDCPNPPQSSSSGVTGNGFLCVAEDNQGTLLQNDAYVGSCQPDTNWFTAANEDWFQHVSAAAGTGFSTTATTLNGALAGTGSQTVTVFSTGGAIAGGSVLFGGANPEAPAVTSVTNGTQFVVTTARTHSNGDAVTFTSRVTNAPGACATGSGRFFANYFSFGSNTFIRNLIQTTATNAATSFACSPSPTCGQIFRYFFSTACGGPLAGNANASGASAEHSTQAIYDTAAQNLYSQMYFADGSPVPIVCNNVVVPASGKVQVNSLSDFKQSNLVSGQCEGCVAPSGAAESAVVNALGDLARSTMFTTLDTIATLTKEFPSKQFILHDFYKCVGGAGCPTSRGTTQNCNADATNCGQITVRIFTAGVNWLGGIGNFDNMILSQNMSSSDPTTLNAYPESTIFPHTPLKTMACVGDQLNGNSLCPGAVGAFGTNGSGCTNLGAVDNVQVGGARDLVVSCSHVAGRVFLAGYTPTTGQSFGIVVNGTTVTCSETTGNTIAQDVSACVTSINANGTINANWVATSNNGGDGSGDGTHVIIADKVQGLNIAWTLTATAPTNGGTATANGPFAGGVYCREFSGPTNIWGKQIANGQAGVCVNGSGTDATLTAGMAYLAAGGGTAISQTYGHMITNDGLSLVGADNVTAGCSTVTGCPTSVINPQLTTITFPFTLKANTAVLMFQ